MTLSADDRTAIADLINLHGHLTDGGDFDGLREVFVPGVVYDVSDLGGGVIVGLAALRDAALALGEANPVAHHVTNIVVTEAADGRARALSKGLGVNADGTTGSVTYEDTLVRGDHGWRISHRTVRARRIPLTP
ncbi:nuclear transport factor 2 family protein [Microbispora sp. KK1-11]|uniref:nuclear transport factor 2 family protein n=1 Tax=Microbispora sp. KK1-11 TaxID=2053005 RepID=UPI00115B9568|nr:nuclear transport factor 2 family protein [Microbispora sp. KK1-11]TQS27745.1 nuclear transport factor 2 family protein [Microbispora sp. KK1-11]